MTLTEKKAAALTAYKSAKCRYFETISQDDWMVFCEARRVCMLLGVRI